MPQPPVGVAALAEALHRGELTAVQATEHYLSCIVERDAEVNSLITLTSEHALRQARASDRRRAQGRVAGPLDGVPITVKDNIHVAGVPTTAGIDGWRNRLSENNAAVIEYLNDAGAVILGKTNMDEAAFGATTDNPAYGRCHNPNRHGYTPGGSSGGSAAAVSAGFCAGALGTDTLGSVRIPAAYCGCFGLKPTRGLVSNRGVVSLSWSLDTIGPLAPRLVDLALLMSVLCRHDPRCPNSRQALQPPPLPADGASGTRIGIIPDLARRVAIDSTVLACFDAEIERLRQSGARLFEIDCADYDFDRMRLDGLLISEAEAAVVHATELKTDPQGYSEELRRYLSWGANQSAERLALAHHQVRQVRVIARQVFAAVDVIVMPTAPQTAFAFGTAVPANQADLTSFANLAGCPALSVPVGVGNNDLPVGLQLIGPEWADLNLLSIAETLDFQ